MVRNNGIAQVPVLIGLAILTLLIPTSIKISQQGQDLRGDAQDVCSAIPQSDSLPDIEFVRLCHGSDCVSRQDPSQVLSVSPGDEITAYFFITPDVSLVSVSQRFSGESWQPINQTINDSSITFTAPSSVGEYEIGLAAYNIDGDFVCSNRLYHIQGTTTSPLYCPVDDNVDCQNDNLKISVSTSASRSCSPLVVTQESRQNNIDLYCQSIGETCDGQWSNPMDCFSDGSWGSYYDPESDTCLPPHCACQCSPAPTPNPYCQDSDRRGKLICVPEGGMNNRYDSDTLIVTNCQSDQVKIKVQENLCDYTGTSPRRGYACNTWVSESSEILASGEERRYTADIPICKIAQLDINTDSDPNFISEGGCYDNNGDPWSGGLAYTIKANPDTYPICQPSSTPTPTFTSTPTPTLTPTSTPTLTPTLTPTSTPTPYPLPVCPNTSIRCNYDENHQFINRTVSFIDNWPSPPPGATTQHNPWRYTSDVSLSNGILGIRNAIDSSSNWLDSNRSQTQVTYFTETKSDASCDTGWYYGTFIGFVAQGGNSWQICRPATYSYCPCDRSIASIGSGQVGVTVPPSHGIGETRPGFLPCTACDADQDQDVDRDDIDLIANCFGQEVPNGTVCDNYDLNSDEIINIFDLVFCGGICYTDPPNSTITPTLAPVELTAEPIQDRPVGFWSNIATFLSQLFN